MKSLLVASGVDDGWHRSFLFFLPLNVEGPSSWSSRLALPFVLASIEDRSDCLLAGGVVCGDVEQAESSLGLQAGKLVDQGLVGCP